MSQPVRIKKSRRLEGPLVLPASKVTKSVDTADAAAAAARLARRKEQEETMATIRHLESELNESKKHMNHVVSLLQYLTLRSPARPEGYAVVAVITASQVLRRFFIANLKAREFSIYSASQRAAQDAKGAIGKVQEWLATQFKKFVAAMTGFVAFAQRDSVPTALQIAAIDSLMDLSVQNAMEDVTRLSAIDAYNPFPQVMIALVAEPHRATEVATHLRASWLDRYDDLRCAALRAFYKIVAGGGVAHESFAGIPVLATLSSAGALSAPAIHENVFALLCDIKPQLLCGANACIISKQLKAADAGQKQRRALSDCWLALLKHPFSQEGYKRVLMAAETVIIPAVLTPVALADFLTDSYNLGGVASVLALGGLFVLITKHGLEYPNFFPRLYAVCDVTAVTAKYRARFFKLIATVLSGAYLPTYLIAAFAKRLCRLALHAPPPAATFVLALTFNLIRKHPMIASLVNRSLSVSRGGLKAATMPQSEFGKLYRLDAPQVEADAPGEKLEADEDASGAGPAAADAAAAAAVKAARPLSLFAAIEASSAASGAASLALSTGAAASAALGSILPGASASAAIGKAVEAAPLLVQAAGLSAAGLAAADPSVAASAAEGANGPQLASDAEAWLEGRDPFVESTDDPSQACALQSSLLELSALCEHYCPDVARLAKLFFAETASKVGHNIDHFTAHTYANIFEYEAENKKNRMVARAYEKPHALLGRSVRPLTADEKYDEEARARVAAINKMPGVLETLFSV